MRFIILFIVFGFIANGTVSRPSEAVENGSEVYAEYEDKESAADEYINEKQDKGSQEIEPRSEPDQAIRTHSLKNNEYENLMEAKLDKNENIDRTQEEMPLSDRHKSNSGHDDIEEDEDFLQSTPNARYNAMKRNQNNNEYISANTDLSSNDGNIDNDRRMTKERNDYNSEAMETRDQPLYRQITYYNKVQGDLFHKKKPIGVFNSYRDRRETSLNQQETLNDDNITEKKESESNNEDSVSAIKRNIKKLSKEELEDLLNSLSDDKRALLNKIINNKITNENVNKREITKKAGAVEENNYLENSRSDLNKLESGSSVDSVSALSQSETTETSKQTESGESLKTKAPESDENTSPNNENKDELNDINLNINQESMQNDVAQSKDNDGKEKLKNDNKRETNIEDLKPDEREMINESSNNENYDLDKDSNWSELLKDESELHKSYSDLYKRDVDDSNTADIKSLEDSFPYYEADNTKSSDSQMAPLIRVKRTNNIKRSLVSSGNVKVPYFPVNVNDDNDKDEFDDGSNFENSYNYEKVGNEANKNFGFYNMRSNKNCQNTKPSLKSEKDSAKIGSDTDNILSNAEGVDDNLMYNNNKIRKKRVADDADANKLQQDSLDAVASFDENDTSGLLSKNDEHYQDQDAFAAIQRGSNEELGRYKRIRRLKQSPSQEEPH